MRAPDDDQPKPFDDSYLLRQGWQRTHEHPYPNADGKLLFEKLRYQRADPDEPKGYEKKIFFRHRIGANWYWGIGKSDEQLPLYHLQDIISAQSEQPVYVLESEKIVERLAALGLIATCCATTWSKTDVEPLRGRALRILADNDIDGAGERKAQAAVDVLIGIAASIRVVRGGPPGGNLADRLDDEITPEEFDDFCVKVKPLEVEQEPPPAPLVFVKLSEWIGVPVPQRDWCVLHRIPARNVTAYAGHGGTGKTITAMQLAAATVLGKDWLRSVPEPGPFLYFSTEDDELEMHRRFTRIAEHYGASISDLLKGGLHLIDHVGKDSVLCYVGRNGVIQPTQLLDRMHEAACDIKPRTVVIDSLADVFAGKENDRAQTRQFVTLLRNLAISANTGIVLIGHPSLSGLASKSGMSGSTDWHNGPRGRMYLEAPTEQGEEPDKGLRVLKVMKQNYGPPGEIVPVRWQNGVFVVEAAPGSLDKLAADQRTDDVFLKLLAQLTEQGRNVSHTPTANNYAPSLFAKHPDGKGTKKELTAAMERLFAACKIRVVKYDRRGSRRIERCEHAVP